MRPLRKEELENIPEEYNVGITVESIQSATLQSLAQIGYQFFMQSAGTTNFKSTTKFYMLVRTIALRLGEIEIAKRLDQIYDGYKIKEKIKLPLPALQYLYNRDAKIGYTFGKSYDGGAFTLVDVITSLDKAEREMCDLYTRLIILHDIDVAYVPPKPDLGGEEEEML
jgi:hypothetical protein